MDEETLFDIWFETKNLAQSTRETYQRYTRQYAAYTGKSLPELREEAMKEKQENIFSTDRKYNIYALRFIKHLREGGVKVRTL